MKHVLTVGKLKLLETLGAWLEGSDLNLWANKPMSYTSKLLNAVHTTCYSIFFRFDLKNLAHMAA